MKSSPRSPQLEKARAQQQRPNTAKKKKKKWPRSFPFASNQPHGKTGLWLRFGGGVPALQCARKSHGTWGVLAKQRGTPGKPHTKSALCWMREQGSLCGSCTGRQILTLKRPAKGIWDIYLWKKEGLWPNSCHSPPWGSSESSPPFTLNYGHTDEQNPQNIHPCWRSAGSKLCHPKWLAGHLGTWQGLVVTRFGKQ